jgi:hypothetical protein
MTQSHPPHAWVRAGELLSQGVLVTWWTCSCPWSVFTYDGALPDANARGGYTNPAITRAQYRHWD